MKTSEKVRAKIDKFEKGYVFTYNYFDIEVSEAEALKKYLNRLVESGKIERLSKGRFYKPRKGIIGNLKPDEYEVVKDLLIDGNKTVGYITGYSIFNRLKLTTQVPNVIQIGVNFDKKEIKRNIYSIKFVRQWNKITKANIPLLQLLDCIRFIKTIPDTTIANSLNRIIVLLNELPESEKKQIIDLAINYPPSTRALTGAVFEQLGYPEMANKLLRTLKSTTWYSFNIPQELLPDKLKWKIK
jgi:predicted transcriptional regulator of viral defense system